MHQCSWYDGLCVAAVVALHYLIPGDTSYSVALTLCVIQLRLCGCDWQANSITVTTGNTESPVRSGGVCASFKTDTFTSVSYENPLICLFCRGLKSRRSRRGCSIPAQTCFFLLSQGFRVTLNPANCFADISWGCYCKCTLSDWIIQHSINTIHVAP